MKKLIVTVAPTSNFHGKEANPALPFSPEEAAKAVLETGRLFTELNVPFAMEAL